MLKTEIPFEFMLKLYGIAVSMKQFISSDQTVYTWRWLVFIKYRVLLIVQIITKGFVDQFDRNQSCFPLEEGLLEIWKEDGPIIYQILKMVSWRRMCAATKISDNSKYYSPNMVLWG